jgi:hypothetical protein
LRGDFPQEHHLIHKIRWLAPLSWNMTSDLSSIITKKSCFLDARIYSIAFPIFCAAILIPCALLSDGLPSSVSIRFAHPNMVLLFLDSQNKMPRQGFQVQILQQWTRQIHFCHIQIPMEQQILACSRAKNVQAAQPLVDGILYHLKKSEDQEVIFLNIPCFLIVFWILYFLCLFCPILSTRNTCINKFISIRHEIIPNNSK